MRRILQISAVTVLLTACVHDKSSDGGLAPELQAACAAVCGFAERCSFNQVAVCSDVQTPDLHVPYCEDGAKGGAPGCVETCVALWAEGEQSAACKSARQREWACVYNSACEVFVHFKQEDVCVDEDEAAYLACGRSWDDGPVVALDPTRPILTRMVAAGACAVSDDLQMVDMSVLLLDGQYPLLPDDFIAREVRPVAELLTPDRFTFVQLDSRPSGFEEPGFVERVGSDEAFPVYLQAEAVNFHYVGGVERKDKDKLVVFAIDHSGSLVGADPQNGEVEVSRASDPADGRIAFARQLLGSLPESWFASLVWFNDLPTVTPEYANPTRDREVISGGLTQLQTQEAGRTALADAIDQAYTRVISAGDNADLNPVIVLITDGVEEGDVSTRTLAEAKAKLLAHKPPVPVIVLHVQPSEGSGLPRGRSPELVDLACETGGEYIFLERAEEFMDSTANLAWMVRERLTGIWRVTTWTSMKALDSGAYLLSTEMEITLGLNDRSVRLAAARDGIEFHDTRLWFRR